MGERQAERLFVFEGVDQDLLHFETTFNEGQIQFVDDDNNSRAQLRFIVTNNGTDSDDILTASDAYTIPFKASLMGDWLATSFEALPDRFGILTGGDGNDELYGSTQSGTVPVVYLDGGLGEDLIYGSDVDGYVDQLYGQEGNDIIHGLRGINLLYGGSGNDKLYGGFNNDTLEGGAGFDFIQGGEGSDTASYAGDASGVTVNLSWRHNPIVILPAFDGNIQYFEPDTPLIDVSGDLRNVAEALVKTGKMRFDPNLRLSDFLVDVFSENGKIPLPELFDTSTPNPLLLVPADTNAEILKVDGDILVRELDSDARSAIELLLRRSGVAPRATMSVAEAAELAKSNHLISLASMKVKVTDVPAFAAVDGSDSRDQLATSLVTLPGSSVAEASIARDAARLLMIGSNELETTLVALADEQAAKILDSETSTPITDAIEAALTQNLQDAESVNLLIESGIKSGSSNDLASWLTTFAIVIAELKPDNLSSLSTLESLSGVVSQIENISGSSYSDLLIGDNQNNKLEGSSGDDILIGSKGNDYLHGGTGQDRLYGGDGSDYLEGGGGKDVLEGGSGDDRYSLLTPTLTLESAFRALGGDPTSLAPIERNGESISWEKFKLWADPTRWQGQVQWQQYERLGFIPDKDLYKRAASDKTIGWLLHGQGGSIIRDSGGLVGAEDELILQLPGSLSLDGPQNGVIGMARGNGAGRTGNSDLIIDINADGILDPKSDLTIEDYFFKASSGPGAISAIRQYGLRADYYQGSNFDSPLVSRVDSTVDFNWGYLLPDGSSGNATSGLSARWTGELVPSVQGEYRFRVTTDSELKSSWELFIDGILVKDSSQLLELKQDRAVDLELRWIDEANNQGSGDHSIKLEWAKDNEQFKTIDVEHLRTGKTITSIDILGAQDLLIPILNRELFTGETRNWQGSSQWGDIDNDGDLDLLVFSFDDLGNGESQVLINEINSIGSHSFTSSLDLPVFERVHSAQWGDWNNDGYLDILVAGIRSNDDFIRSETVEILVNKGGVSFEIATPDVLNEQIANTWLSDSNDGGDPSKHTLRAAWGDIDNDGLLDLAITNSSDAQVLVVPSASDAFTDQFVAGMEGAQLQFGYFESSDGDVSFADRGLAGQQKPLRLADGMDLAVHRSWMNTEYSTVTTKESLLFWDSSSNLFDLQRDLVGLDSHLSELASQLDPESTESDFLQTSAFIELNPQSSDIDLSYSFYRIDRELLQSAIDPNSSSEDPIGFQEEALTFEETVDLAKKWFITSETSVDSDYLDPGASSTLDHSLLTLESEWEYLGDGVYNRNPINFRYDPDYFYFLEFDTTLVGSLDSHPDASTIYQTFSANDLLGRDPTTGAEQTVSGIPVSRLKSDQRELIEALLAGTVETIREGGNEDPTSPWMVRARRIVDNQGTFSINPIIDSFKQQDSFILNEQFDDYLVKTTAFVDGTLVEASAIQSYGQARNALLKGMSTNNPEQILNLEGTQNQALSLEFIDPSSFLPFMRVNMFADITESDGVLIQKIDLLDLPLTIGNIPENVITATLLGSSNIDYLTSSMLNIAANDVSVDTHSIGLDFTDTGVLQQIQYIMRTNSFLLSGSESDPFIGLFEELGYEIENNDVSLITIEEMQGYLNGSHDYQEQLVNEETETRPIGEWINNATSMAVLTSTLDGSPILAVTLDDGRVRHIDTNTLDLINQTQEFSGGDGGSFSIFDALSSTSTRDATNLVTSTQLSLGTVTTSSIEMTSMLSSALPSPQYLLLSENINTSSDINLDDIALGSNSILFDWSNEIEQAVNQVTDISFAPVSVNNPFDQNDKSLFGMSVLYGATFAEMNLFDVALTSVMDGYSGYDVQTPLLSENDVISIDGYLNFTDTIHQLKPSITINLTPLETPLEVVSIDAAAEDLRYAEGSIFSEGLVAAFGDINLGGNVSDLYTSGPAGAALSLDPEFITKRGVSTSAIPEQLVSPIKSFGFSLLDRDVVEGSSLQIKEFKTGDSLAPIVSNQAQVGLVRDFNLRELLGKDPVIGMTYQVDVKARFGSPDTHVGLRVQIVDQYGTRLVNRLQDVELQSYELETSSIGNTITTDNTTTNQPFELTDQDILVFRWSTELEKNNALLRISPEHIFPADIESIENSAINETLPYSDVLISTGRVTIPALDEGYATWADVDNDGDQDLLLTGIESQSGLLTTRLLSNPLIGDGDSFTDISIALPGLQNGNASWADFDRDGDLDLAITGAQGSEQLPYLQIFENTTSHRLVSTELGEAPFTGILNRQPDQPTDLVYSWHNDDGGGAVQLQWQFSHLQNDDAPYTYNLGLLTQNRLNDDAVFDVLSPLADPISGERLIASPGNQGFNNAGLFRAGQAGETYYWAVQAIDAGMRSSGWSDGESFTLQPLMREFNDGPLLAAQKIRHFSVSTDQPTRSIASFESELKDAINDGLEFYIPEFRTSLEAFYKAADDDEFIKNLLQQKEQIDSITKSLERHQSFAALRKLLARAIDSGDETLLGAFALISESNTTQEAWRSLDLIQDGASAESLRNEIDNGNLQLLLSEGILSASAVLQKSGLPTPEPLKLDAAEIKDLLFTSEQYLSSLLDGSVVTLRLGLELDSPELVMAAEALNQMHLARTYLVLAQSELLFNVQNPSSGSIDNPLLNEYSNLSTESFRHEIKVDLDQDGLEDRIRFDDSTQEIHVDQNDGDNGYKPFVGPTMVMSTDNGSVDNTFLALLTDTATDVHLTAIDRSFILDDARSSWTLSLISEDSSQLITSFSTGDDLDLDANHVLRQRYKLTEDSEKVNLYLNGTNLREEIPAILDDNGDIVINASTTNLSFTLEDMRSGAIRAEFNGREDLNDPDAASVVLTLQPLNGNSSSVYQLHVEDIGDGRPDLLVRWRDGEEEFGSLTVNASVHSNTAPLPPQLHSLELNTNTDGSFSGLSGRFSLGTDQESLLTLTDHQLLLTVSTTNGSNQSMVLPLTSSWLIPGSDDQFLIPASDDVFMDVEPTSITAQLQAMDAGLLSAVSAPLDVVMPEPVPIDQRPELQMPHGIRLTEGDTLEHKGNGLIPLLLRDRELSIDLPDNSDFIVSDTLTIKLIAPSWLLEVGQFTDSSGTALVLNSIDQGDLLEFDLSNEVLEDLCFQPTRLATGRIPLSLQFKQPLEHQGITVNPVVLTQPLELRLRNGGDRIPSTTDSVFPNDPKVGDIWTINFPSGTRLIDGVSGRELLLSDSNGYVDGYGLLPGWQELLGSEGTANDLQLSITSTSITAQGQYSRSFIDSLQVLNADLTSSDEVITLSYQPENSTSTYSKNGLLGVEVLTITDSNGVSSSLPIDNHLTRALAAQDSSTAVQQGWVMNEPIVITSDRSLQIPVLLQDSDYTASIERVHSIDGAADVLTGSLTDSLLLQLPQEDTESVAFTLNVAANNVVSTDNFGSLLAIHPGSFGINTLANGVVLEVTTSGLTGVESPLWLRWFSTSHLDGDVVAIEAGFQLFDNEADALNSDRNVRNTAALDLTEIGDLQLNYLPPVGIHQAYELSFSKDGVTDASLSRLVFIESDQPAAVVAHLDVSAGLGADHQLTLPVGLSDALVDGATRASAEGNLSIPGDLAGNLLGRDIGEVTAEPSWQSDGALASSITVNLRGDRITPADYLSSDPRSERATESFLLTVQPDAAISPAEASTIITLVNDDHAPSLSITAIDQLSDTGLHGREITITAVIEADRPISSDQVREGRVLLLRPDGLQPLRLGKIAFNADGLQSSLSATARLQLPHNLAAIDLDSGGFRLAVDVIGGLQAVSDPFAWSPTTVEAPETIFSLDRFSIENLNVVAGELQLALPEISSDTLKSLSLSLSTDSVFSAADLLLEADRNAIELENLKFKAFEPAGGISTSRWLLQAQHDLSSGRTLHQAYYRPELIATDEAVENNQQPNEQALISGLQLPSAIVQANGDQLTLLSIREGDIQIWPDPTQPELNVPATAQAWSERLSDLELSLSAGEHELNLTLVEHPAEAGSLTLFDQILHLKAVNASSVEPITPLVLDSATVTITEGSAVLLVHASDADISEALASLDPADDGSDPVPTDLGLQLAVQLQMLNLAPDSTTSEETPEQAADTWASRTNFVRSLQPFLYDNSTAQNGQGVAISGFELLANNIISSTADFNAKPLRIGDLEAWLLQPDRNLAGDYEIRAIYSDGRSQLIQTIADLTIENTADAPQLASGKAVLDQLSWQLQTGEQPDGRIEINLDQLVYDADTNDTLIFTLAPGSVIPEGVEFDADAGQLSIDALPYSSIGEHIITVMVSDGDTNTADLSLHFDLSISARNFSPVWNLPPQLDARLDVEASWDLQQQRWVLDPDGDSLRFSLSNPPPGGVSFSDGVLTVDPELAEAGRYTLNFNVSDGADRPMVAASTVLQLSRVAPAQPARLMPLSSAERIGAEGRLMSLPLQFDRPLATAATVQWMVHGGSDQVVADAPLRGSLQLEAGATSAMLQLQLADDNQINPSQQFFLQLESDSTDLQLPKTPLALRQLDNDGIAAQLKTRWHSATEVELVYNPAAEAMATTGLRIELRDPSGSGLLQEAEQLDRFAMGWQAPISDHNNLVLEWRDPLAATWPSLSEVSLLRLQLKQPLPANTELLVAATSGRSDVAVHWLDQPWVEPDAVALDAGQVAIAEAQQAGQSIVIEQGMANAVRFSEQGALEFMDVAVLLERRYSANPSIAVNAGGNKVNIDLSSELQEIASSVRLNDHQWGLLPPLADGASRLGLQAEQVMVLSAERGRLEDVSLQPLSDVGYEQLLQGLTVSGALGDSQSLQPVYGVMNFTYTDIEPGSLQTVWIDLPYRSVVDGVLSKPDALGAWSPFTFDAVDGTGAIFHDDDEDGFDDRVEIRLRDGGRGDADGVINGEIVDPAIATSSDASNVPEAPTHVDMEMGNLLGVDGTLNSTSDPIDAISFTVAPGQRLWTLKIEDLIRNGGAVEAWIFSENDTIDLEATSPQILTSSSTELLSLPLSSGDYTLVLRQLGGTSSYALRGVAEAVMPAAPTFTLTLDSTELNEGRDISTTIATTNVDPGTAIYWKLEKVDGSDVNTADFVTTISGSVNLDAQGNAVIVTSTVADYSTEGDEQFRVLVYTDSTFNTLVASSAAITINDTSVNPLPSYALHASERVDEGNNVLISVVTSNVPEGTTLHWQLLPANSATVTPDDFTTETKGTAVISNSGTSEINVAINKDSLTEGEEQFQIALYMDEEFNQLLTSQEVIINDTSEDFKQQVIIDTPSTIAFRVNESIALPLVYTTNSGEAGSASLSLSLYYRSDVLTLSNLNDLITSFDAVSVIDDINDLDGVSSTDKILQLEITDLQQSYGIDLPAVMAEPTFSTPEDGLDPITGNPLNSLINVRATSSAGEDDLITGHNSVALKAVGLGFDLDVDQDGNVTALGDGLMVIRHLFGSAFQGEALINKAINPNSALFSQEGLSRLEAAERIAETIQYGIDSKDLDVDLDGKVTALGDGLMVIRRLFGSAFEGEALINKAISPESSLIPAGSSLTTLTPEEKDLLSGQISSNIDALIPQNDPFF